MIDEPNNGGGLEHLHQRWKLDCAAGRLAYEVMLIGDFDDVFVPAVQRDDGGIDRRLDMRKLTIVGLLFFACIATACAGRINNMMRSWEGHALPELIAKWGPPQQVFADGRGGQVFVYTQTRSFTVPGHATTTTNMNGYTDGSNIYGTATSQTIYTPAMTQQWQVYRMFFLDSRGRIYRWAWRGF